MKHPLMYQINTRAVLQERGVALKKAATLEDLPDAYLDEIAAKGFEWVWLLGVWQTGQAAREISRSNPRLVDAYCHIPSGDASRRSKMLFPSRLPLSTATKRSMSSVRSPRRAGMTSRSTPATTTTSCSTS